MRVKLPRKIRRQLLRTFGQSIEQHGHHLPANSPLGKAWRQGEFAGAFERLLLPLLKEMTPAETAKARALWNKYGRAGSTERRRIEEDLHLMARGVADRLEGGQALYTETLDSLRVMFAASV